MRRSAWIIIIYLLCHNVSTAQSTRINRQQFFLDDRVIEATLTTDIRKVRNDKKNSTWEPGNIVMVFPDSSQISADVKLKPRGIFRKENCDMASLMVDFKSTTPSKLSSLKSLKLVGGCHSGSSDEALLLKEYLAYKIYNFVSNMSFRVRLLHITYKDSKEKAKGYTQYAFLIEDMKDLAERNNCFEIKRGVATESTDRQQINFVSIFQYMIGNTDWSVPVLHNIKLMVPKKDSLAKPYPIAYDFDYAGIVNAPYAAPNEELEQKSVTERIYRGFPRNTTELQENIDKFKEKKDQIMFYLNNFQLLGGSDKKALIRYISDFFKTIEDKKECKSIFIDRARTD
jgi:hypothetical protein